MKSLVCEALVMAKCGWQIVHERDGKGIRLWASYNIWSGLYCLSCVDLQICDTSDAHPTDTWKKILFKKNIFRFVRVTKLDRKQVCQCCLHDYNV